MSDYKDKNIWKVIIIGLIIFNVFLYFHNKELLDKNNSSIVNNLKFGSLAPNFSLHDFEDKIINLDDYKNNLVLLLFIKLNVESVPDLIYYQILYEKFKDKGFRLLVITKDTYEAFVDYNNLLKIHIPVLYDKEGYVHKIYGGLGFARCKMVLIKDKKIQFSSIPGINVTHETIFKILKRLIIYSKMTNMKRNYSNIKFLDIEDEKIKYLNDYPSKFTLINFLTSGCTSCGENARINLLKQLSQMTITKNTNLAIIFSRDNTLDYVKEFTYQYGLDTHPFIIGITQESTKKDLTEYYKKYNLKIDPQLILVDRDQNVIFNEKYSESSAKILKELTVHLAKINEE